jgi:hypothetical protein
MKFPLNFLIILGYLFKFLDMWEFTSCDYKSV